jgi:hypothetical protein
MKRFLVSAMAAMGMSSPAVGAGKVEAIDASKLRYSMPTVAADQLEFQAPTKSSIDGAPQFHEDEWAQLEFFPKSRLAEIQKSLSEFKIFERANRSQNGWTNIYARKFSRTPLVVPGVSPKRLSGETSYPLLPAPILSVASSALGQIKDGFSLNLGLNAQLYGLANAHGISVLSAHLAGADDMLLSNAFSVLNRSYGLILVDWRQQFVLVSVAPDGKFNFWRP